jgi:hypothetical protein
MSVFHALTQLVGHCLVVIEGPLWLIFLATLAPTTLRAVRRIGKWGQGSALAAVLGLAVVLRMAVPWEPIYWHYPLMNVDVGGALYTRQNSYLPLLLRFLVFDLHGGFDAALAFNLIAGTASIVLLWYAALAGGHSTRVCVLFGVLLAITPMYVRHSASDSVYMPILLLYAACAAAFGSLASGETRWPVAALMVSAVLLGMPIRAEAAWVFLGVPFFRLHFGSTIRDVIRPRLPVLLLTGAVLVGSVAILDLQSHSFGERLSLQLDSIVLGLIAQALCLPGPDFPAFFPPLIAVPIWLTTIDQFKRRAWHELASIYVPVWFSRVPHLFGAAFMVGGLATTGYHIVSVLFILLASSRCLEQLYLRHLRGEFLLDARWWRAALFIGGAAMAILCVHAYGYRYVEGQEMRFLRSELPRDQSTVLVIWDPDPSPGDDCCLSLPYPPLWAQLPHTRWIVLTLADLQRPEYIRNLEFDLYYPGSTVQLEDSTTWLSSGEAGPGDERLRNQREGLRRLRELDALVRREHVLVPWRRMTVPAHTPSFAHFKNDEVTFAIDRRVQRSVGTSYDSSTAAE